MVVSVVVLLSLIGYVRGGGVVPCPKSPSVDDIDPGDTAWLVFASALVLLMTPGLAFFYGGLVKSKNILNTLMLSFSAMGLIVLHWVLFGYSFAFAPGSSIFGSFKWGGLYKVGVLPSVDYGPTIPHIAHMNFELMFAIITPALISGGIVERVKFKSYIIFIFLWSTFVYDTMVHWMWSTWTEYRSDGTCYQHNGWLRDFGALDYAGGMVIHVSSGFSALVAAAMVGKRVGYDPKNAPIPGNVPFVLLGSALLWFGWLGFNGGSAGKSGGANGIAAIALANTSISGAVAFLTWLLVDVAIRKQPSAVGAATGAIIGLVCVTPASGFIDPAYAIIFGFVGAGLSYLSMRLKKVIKLDDSLDVFYCHGVGGMVGSFMTGLFANGDGGVGAFFGNPKQIGIQVAAILITIALSTILTALILLVLKKTIGLTLDSHIIEQGIDQQVHGEKHSMEDDIKEALSQLTVQEALPELTNALPTGPIHYRPWEFDNY
eukprot:TRINITY_DN792_c0_g2_i3.p1 TRINITY_DN792_c0_g2~~TRINITY_DN792_c0_g2_i3.p1  ORF type:complete len:488 (-),score=83.64 TRINITY_DN792_c0_g2_i3:177-1640(-)